MDGLVEKFDAIRGLKFEEFSEHETLIMQYLQDFFDEYVVSVLTSGT